MANVSPSVKHLAETTHTLNFASKSRQITNSPVINEMPHKGDVKARRPSPLISTPPATSLSSDIKDNFELSQRVAILEAKLGANASNIASEKKNSKAFKQIDNMASPVKPAKRRRQIGTFNDDLEAEETTIASSLWSSIQETLKNGSGSESLMDDYILLLANSGSTCLIKKLPGIGEKRANAIIDARLAGGGAYRSISEMEIRCDFKPKLISSIRQALFVQALYGTSGTQAKAGGKENIRNL